MAANTTSETGNRGIWVISDFVLSEDKYVLSVELTADASYAMDQSQALEFVAALLGAAGAARFDAALNRQLTQKLDFDPADAALVVNELRKRRRNQTWEAGPVKLTPGVSGLSGKPFVDMDVPGESHQLDTEKIEEIARHVLQQSTSVQYDNDYYKFLTTKQDLDPDTARNVVSDLRNHRHDEG